MTVRLAPVALLLLGCASPLETAGRSLGAVGAIADTLPVLDLERRAALEACVLELDAGPCVTRVAWAWAPVERSARAVRRRWLDASTALHVAEAAAARGERYDMGHVGELVTEATRAAAALQEAMMGLRAPLAGAPGQVDLAPAPPWSDPPAGREGP